MKQIRTPLSPRAALLIGAALVATPAVAQDAPAAQQSVTPPPILVAPAPAPPPIAAPVIRMQPASPVVQPLPPEPVAEAEAARAAPARTPTRTAARPAAREARASAPAAAPAPEAAPAQPATAEPPATAPTAPVAEPAPAAQAPIATSSTEQTTTQSSNNSLAWIIGGLVVALAAIGAFLLLRRRRPVEEDYADYRAEPEAERPMPAVLPVVAPELEPRAEPQYAPFVAAPTAAIAERPVEPAAHSDIALAEPDAEDLATVADVAAPVANRPWIELAMRPVRAGTSEDEALVDVELTVGNAGDTPARDVRISTFLLADAEPSAMESLLIEPHAAGTVPPVTIAPGDGTRVDAQLAVPKGELGRTFNPVVVAEARYTLPDGSEGRTAAAFRIGRPSNDGIGPIGATRPHMVDAVEAELVGEPEHA
ncbi:hypothetical protein ACG3SL_11535 [Sphingomonas sp. CJ20]